ncbi:MAG: aldehyde dehydrogenase family protein, partial [Planctomycetota bacterium]|nr:aldehyde dehydrogenase family protein [Planctomycetota bacterium]
DELAALITAELGAPLDFSRRVQAGLPVAVLGSMAQLATEVEREETVGNSRVVRQPVGVVAAITPWNYPLHQVVAKVAPALAAGCTVVVKPSELCPLSSFLFAEVVAASGLPPGVFQLVPGAGHDVGEALASHRDVDLVSFTGSTRAGRRVAELAGRDLRRVALELGGKSPCVVLDEGVLARAVPACVASAFQNSGQTCSALTRLIVPRARLAEATELAREAARGFRTGDPLDPATRLGPLVSSAQRERVRGFIARALAAGQKLVVGGPDAPAGLERGWFVAPTVFTDVDPAAELAREEVFGPVLALFGHDGDEHALALANDTPYGLAAAVWSSDGARAERLGRRIRAGQVDLNGAKWNLLAPFGGFKASGQGRELGRHGLEEFTELQALQS